MVGKDAVKKATKETSAAKASDKKAFQPGKHAWTLDKARQQLALNANDPYLQYVLMQLAGQEQKEGEILLEIQNANASGMQQIADRRNSVDLFNMFSGALAVQESLQLDTMRGDRPARKPTKQVAITDLKGPAVKSHPWKEMLAGKNPKVSELSRMVPADQYLVQARSLTKLLELMEFGDLWATHLFNQATQDATSSRLGERLREQLAVRSDPLSKPFYDSVVEQVAITGSDLYLREGSDVTLIFRVKQPGVFKVRMDSFLSEAVEKNPGASQNKGKFQGVEYTHVTTPDRRVHVFSAYPQPNLHVRGNSKVGLERVLAAMQPGSAEVGERLGDTDEFKYIRTLMPEGDKLEDALIYFSDPFIRRLVGPKTKLTERRRLLSYNHMRMIGHAAMLFQTQYGRRAESLKELADGRCSPGLFGTEDLQDPLGGAYSLSPDGTTAMCSATGSPFALIPNAELPLDKITQEEADEYQAFLEDYNQHWRIYFDPIAVRVQTTPERYRVETIVLPLIDNSIYTSLAATLGGKPGELDSLPVPKGNIFSAVVQLNKENLLKQAKDFGGDLNTGARMLTGDENAVVPDLQQFVEKGLGSQVGLHLMDSTQLFDFNFSGFLGQMLGTFNNTRGLQTEVISISVLVASLNSPLYISLPVQDVKIVDEFLEQLDPLLAAQARRPERGGMFDVGFDFYHLEQGKAKHAIRTSSLSFGPLKWRFFWSRIDDGLYIATKRSILNEIAAAAAERKQAAEKLGVKSDPPRGHAMVRIRPESWKQVLADFQLGWAENNREACLKNLGPLSNVARAYVATRPDALTQDPAKAAAEIVHEADNLYGVHFLPLDGKYLLARDGLSVTHNVYGSPLAPRQPAGLAEGSDTADVVRDFGGATAELTFMEDGLHAVLTLEKRPKK